MADNLLFPFSGQVIMDSSGTPLSGAKLEVFDEGTTNQKTVYEDDTLLTPAANPVVTNSAGVVPKRYLGTGDWKVTFKSSADVTLSNYDTWDNVPGAIDTSSFLTGTVAPSRASISKTGAYTTVNATDNGKQINCDATGGDFTITLDAATVGDGKDYVVKNTGETGVVTVDRGGSSDNVVLGPLDSATFRSDGATWQTAEAFNATDGTATIAYAASITPDLIHSTNTEYVTTLTGDITINNPTSVRPGTRGTFRYVNNAASGYQVSFGANFSGLSNFAVAAGDTAIIGFVATATDNIELFMAKGASNSELVAAFGKEYAGAVGSATTSAWTTLPLDDTALFNDDVGIGDASSNAFTLPPGEYQVKVTQSIDNCGLFTLRLRDSGDTTTYGINGLAVVAINSQRGNTAHLDTLRFTIASQTTFVVQYYATTAGTLGSNNSGNGLDSLVSLVTVERYS